jgi:hypothetical protein
VKYPQDASKVSPTRKLTVSDIHVIERISNGKNLKAGKGNRKI